jgi:hypothetical protein
MSYSAPDMSDDLIDLLKKKGYTITYGNGFETRSVSPDYEEWPEPTDPSTYNADIDGCWFTWTQEGCDVEVGPTQENELNAWGDAMCHFFEHASIPTQLEAA